MFIYVFMPIISLNLGDGLVQINHIVNPFLPYVICLGSIAYRLSGG